MPDEVFGALEDAFFAAGDAATEPAAAGADQFLDLDTSPPERGLTFKKVIAARAWLALSLRAAALFCLWRARLLHFRVAVAVSVRRDNRFRAAFVHALRPFVPHHVSWLPRASRVILLSVLVNYSAAVIAAAAGVL
jgi:hypothetical protein